ncbi:PVR cell adhesion molecule related 2 like isoform X2 [Anguilla anguilla]|uniref:PVR cell adhesion molecule related 2 like isoform X2 n=1 Tax=Anguilla anguilla TaxID=7936 RepID=UPI0015A97EB9|nr:PVR cell adhesion molecule related 2 like isoform X2 [Anguilla anguilla]
MARDYAGKCLDFRKNCGLSMGFILIIIGGVTAHVKVKSEVESYPGQMVNLSCEFMSSEGIRLTQVSWIWEPKEGQRENIAVFHPQFGDSYPESALSGRVRFLHGSLENPSISISDVRMTDEGKYVCEYATYPSGNEQGTTTLVMLAKPKNTASVVTVTEGTSAVVVARCESADGRPEAEITWETQAAGKEARTAQAGVMNTVTVLSEYRLVPTAEDDGRDIACVVSHRTQGAPQILRLKLSIEHLPKVRILGYDSDWYRGRTDATLVCEAIGNPEPTNITWKTASGPLPDTVQVRENTLTVRHVDEAVNTTFVCEAQNRLGASTEQVTTLITERPKVDVAIGTIVGVVIGVLLLLVIIIVAIFMIRKQRRNAENGDGPPKYKSPPPAKADGSTEMLNKSQDPLTDPPLASHVYYETTGEPVTDLDGNEEENGYMVGATSGWEDSAQGRNGETQSEALPPYSDPPERGASRDAAQDPGALSPSNREGSFVSAAMYV